MIDHERSSHMPSLTSKFFARPAEEVAPDLIGCYLFTNIGGERCGGMIIETEAYDQNDPFAHCYGVNPDPKSKAMKFAPGHIYLYYSGQLPCLNLVTDKQEFGSAVLIRALLPTCNHDLMHKRRTASYRAKYLDKALNPKRWKTKLCHGPGVLCEALGIDDTHCKKSTEGLTLFEPLFEPLFEIHFRVEEPKLVSGIRVGLDKQFERWKATGVPRASLTDINDCGGAKLRWGADGFQRFMSVSSFARQWIKK